MYDTADLTKRPLHDSHTNNWVKEPIMRYFLTSCSTYTIQYFLLQKMTDIQENILLYSEIVINTFCMSIQASEQKYVNMSLSSKIRGGADKSLDIPTFRCRRTESIVSLERGVCSVPNCKSFLVTEAERKHVRRRARF